MFWGFLGVVAAEIVLPAASRILRMSISETTIMVYDHVGLIESS